jgi:RNA polymerase sigma factor (sigma-70 family)
LQKKCLNCATRYSALPYSMEEVQETELLSIIDGCRRQHRASQQRLYALFYNYTMSVARRYTGALEAAEEVANDAFFKVFTKIDLYAGHLPFKAWLRRIIINTAIDRYRSSIHRIPTLELTEINAAEADDGTIEHLSRQQVVDMLDLLPPAYRTVFNLYVVDGFSHEEISETLDISIGASKSNLSRARQHIKKLLKNELELFVKS